MARDERRGDDESLSLERVDSVPPQSRTRAEWALQAIRDDPETVHSLGTDDELPGTGFIVTRFIRDGRLGTVYAARGPDRVPVAVKVLRPEVSKFAAEFDHFVAVARPLSELGSSHLVQTRGVLRLRGDRIALVMDLVDGVSLRELIKRAPLASERTAAILDQVALALGTVHAAGVLHLDLRPGSVMIDASGGRGDRALIKDLGMTRLANAMLRGGARFDPRRAAPELLRGDEPDVRADVYGLGCLAFEMATGHPPFEASDDAELARMHREDPPPDLAVVAGAPVFLADIVKRCLAKDPAARFPTMNAFRRALSGKPPRHAPGGRRPPPRDASAVEGGPGANAVVASRPPGRPALEPQRLDLLPRFFVIASALALASVLTWTALDKPLAPEAAARRTNGAPAANGSRVDRPPRRATATAGILDADAAAAVERHRDALAQLRERPRAMAPTGATGDSGDSETGDSGDSGDSETGDSGDSETGDAGDSETGDSGDSETGDSEAGDAGPADTGDAGPAETGVAPELQTDTTDGDTKVEEPPAPAPKKASGPSKRERAKKLGELGLAALRAGRQAEAKEHLLAALKLDRKRASVRDGLCTIYTKSGEYAEAVGHGLAAVSFSPKRGSYHVHLGEALLKQGRARTALDHFERAKELGSKGVDARIAQAKAAM